MHPYPLIFEPILKEKVWGGRRLARLGKRVPEGANIGESWELADLSSTSADGGGGDAARSMIANGPMRGMTLADAIVAEGPNLMGSLRLSAAGGFPLLVKFLDASENLSVQVHPSPTYAKVHPGAHLKTESWYVVDAEPGAVIYKGVKSGVTREAFASHVRDNTVVNDMIAIPVQAGDFHHLPSGTCHALGAGVVVAEVQTPSDTTYRVYDWGRTGRKLHLEEALACIAYEPSAPQFAVTSSERPGERDLVATEFYSLRELRTRGDAPASAEHAMTLPSGTGAPAVWMCVSGRGRIESADGGFEPTGFKAGDTLLIPAGLGAARAVGSSGTIILEARLPAGASKR